MILISYVRSARRTSISCSALMQGGAVVIAQHVAPDDDESQYRARWRNGSIQTPGAAQFMIKAKDSDGTVVSGAWPLT
jgi:hypothetical protein